MLVALAAGCGKVGPPQPPIKRVPSRPTRLEAVQLGDRVRLTWSAQNPDLRESSKSSIQRADIYRVRQARGVAPFVLDDDFEEAASIVGFLDAEQIRTMFKD